ncbi:polysaccharide pyruvyl transferase family protein [uncultured Nocardioides sp.]|uniref:polysaccharide pyruvyl transferase family protein n=1 Tax=uncultured Nocardioides sp. TaxID=198441 RepID=UPI002615004F|nr:polysaccharide pyruvyl transferase family protein [uncultured Nocardioides sp.]
MRVLVLWADRESANLGVRVLAEGTAGLVREAFPDAKVVFQDFSGSETGFSLGRLASVRNVATAGRLFREFFSEFDLVFDTGGGDSFADLYGTRRLFMMLNAQAAVTRVGVPLIIGPQTIGPFTHSLNERLAARQLRRASLILTRDSASEAAVCAMGSESHPATDVVFGLPVETPRASRDVLLNVSGLIANGGVRSVGAEGYLTQVRLLIERLLAVGRKVTLFPHVLSNASLDNDIDVCLGLSDHFGGRVDTYVPSSLVDCRETIAGSRVMVGSRMHACLNALSQGVPAIPWAYSRKFAPLLGDLGWDHVFDAHDATCGAGTADLIVHSEEALKAQAAQTAANGKRALTSVASAIREALDV